MKTLNSKKVWFAPLDEIVGHVQGLIDEGVYSPKSIGFPIIQGRFNYEGNVSQWICWLI